MPFTPLRRRVRDTQVVPVLWVFVTPKSPTRAAEVTRPGPYLEAYLLGRMARSKFTSLAHAFREELSL